MLVPNRRSFILLPIFLVLFEFCFSAFGQAIANDDFYVVDTPQFINTYENDVGHDQGYQWTLMLAPSHGGVSLPLGYCPYCSYFRPIPRTIVTIQTAA